MARLYSNENFPLATVVELRRLGHDVLTVLEAGNANQRIDDRSTLQYAIDNGRAMLTLNRRHFIRLHQENLRHAGIVVCTVDPDFIGQAARIDAAVGTVSTLQGQLIRVNRAGD